MGLDVFQAEFTKQETLRALAPRRPGDMAMGLPVICNLRRNFLDNPTSQSDGVATSQTYRIQVGPTLAGCSGLRLLYVNDQYNASSALEADGPNSFTVKASIETGGAADTTGLIFPVYFQGKRTATVEPGGYLLSDPVQVYLPAATNFHVRTYVTAASGEKWILGYPILTGSTGGDQVSASDITGRTPGLTGGGTYSTAVGYGPIAIVADNVATRLPVVGLVGDSITHGYGDTPQYKGYWDRALTAANVPYMNVGTDAERADLFKNTLTGPRYRWRRMRRLGNCTAVVVEFGRNDLSNSRTASQIETDLAEIYAALAPMGVPIYGATITPRTSSTDSWATSGNQTPHASEADRVTLNTWLRTIPSPLAGIVERADVVETARNSGLWKSVGSGVASAYTADGIHPTQTGHTAIAAAVPTAWPA